MWLATKQGFFSVVQHQDDPEIMLVRGRSKQDLECLLALAQECELEMPGIVETPTSDYACRLFLERDVWESLALALIMGIDYPNFKAAVHGDPNRDQAYMQMWSAMRTFQDKQRPGWRQPQFAWSEPDWDYWPNEPDVAAAEDALMTNCPGCGNLVMADEMVLDPESETYYCLDCLYGDEEVTPTEEEVFTFLDALRDSGVTNMFGARPYLEQEFGFHKREAADWLTRWMETYAARHGLEG